MKRQLLSLACLAGLFAGPALAEDLVYEVTNPPLEVTFAVEGGHYSGKVQGGNLFLQTDIPEAPLVKWPNAEAGKLYTLLMLDPDGNANGSWPQAVPPGENSPVRHWIVGNIPGETLRTTGYVESNGKAKDAGPAVVMPYRSPHIPMVSDRYGLYLFEQSGPLEFAALAGPITNFDYKTFLKTYRLNDLKAANFFVAIYVSESPFSGKPFQGNDVSATWNKDLGKGSLIPVRGVE